MPQYFVRYFSSLHKLEQYTLLYASSEEAAIKIIIDEHKDMNETIKITKVTTQ